MNAFYFSFRAIFWLANLSKSAWNLRWLTKVRRTSERSFKHDISLARSHETRLTCLTDASLIGFKRAPPMSLGRSQLAAHLRLACSCTQSHDISMALSIHRSRHSTCHPKILSFKLPGLAAGLSATKLCTTRLLHSKCSRAWRIGSDASYISYHNIISYNIIYNIRLHCLHSEKHSEKHFSSHRTQVMPQTCPASRLRCTCKHLSRVALLCRPGSFVPPSHEHLE